MKTRMFVTLTLVVAAFGANGAKAAGLRGEKKTHWNDDYCHTWRSTLYHQIPGHNIQEKKNISLRECKNLCHKLDGCVSVDYRGGQVVRGDPSTTGEIYWRSWCYLQDVGINVANPNYVQSYWGGYDNYELLPPKQPKHGQSCINNPPPRPISTMEPGPPDKSTPSYKCQHSQYIECPCNINTHLWQSSTKCPYEFDPEDFDRGDHDTCRWAGGYLGGGTTTGYYCYCPKVNGDAYSVDFYLTKKGDQCTNSRSEEG